MNADKFTYWLQGALELNPDMLKSGMTPEQVQTIKDHLDLVFTKVTPDRFKKEEKEESPVFPKFPDLNFPTPESGWNVPFCDGGFKSEEALFCSQLNNRLQVPIEEFYSISGCTLHSIGDTDEPEKEEISFKTSLLKIC
jgi:hypothetical protein